MSISQRIKEERKRRGMTQSDLSEKTNIKQAQIARYESSKSVPSVKLLTGIAEALDVSLDYLVSGRVRIKSDYSEENHELHDRLESQLKSFSDRERKILESLLY